MTDRFDVELDYDVRIPLRDGACLLGNLYRPAVAGQYPAILTYIPYLKDGWGGRGMMDPFQRYFASFGYAVLQLDPRGIGSSPGTTRAPFSEEERRDGYDAVEWLGVQPWCTGSVGMWGRSYGGINSLAIAALRPPHLKAIVPVHATDDNWDSLFEHRGSRLMFWADPHWGPLMAASNLLPPLRGLSDGGEWLRVWRERLDGSQPWHLSWHGEPPEPEYWPRQIVDPTAIDVPTFMTVGWHDAYPDDTLRVYAGLRGPKRLMIGPWKHIGPDETAVHPVGWAELAVRWWDRWLKGIDNGVEHDSRVLLFVQEGPGWRGADDWPLPNTLEQRQYAAPDGQLDHTSTDGVDKWSTYDYDARTGLQALAYDACTPNALYPADQSADDHQSLTFSASQRAEGVDILGQPVVTVFFSVDVPLEDVNIVAKLLDVLPDGTSYLITHENVAARRAQPVGSGPVHQIRLPLRATAYRVRAGHRIRLALSGANFPYLWPTPRRYTLRVHHAPPFATELCLPTVDVESATHPAPPMPAPGKFKSPFTQHSADVYSIGRVLSGRTATFDGVRLSTVEVEPGSRLIKRHTFTMSVDADHPDQAHTTMEVSLRLERPVADVDVRVKTMVALSELTIEAEANMAGFNMLRRSWTKQWG